MADDQEGVSLYLFDGTYELFRNYFAVPKKENSAGEEVGATRGLLRSLVAFLRDHPEPYVAVAFDSVIESFRNELYEGYKSSEGVDEELLAQFPLAEEATRSLGLATWPMVEFEADDALASAAERWKESGSIDRIILCSPDKDLAQCVEGERIVCLDRRRGTVLDEAGVVEKYGVEPVSMPDYLALVGDSADGIPGIPGWGKKSAATLLRVYKSLDEIPEDYESWDVDVRGAAGLAKTLSEKMEEAVLYRKLAYLRDDVPIDENWYDLKWSGPTMTDLQKICRRIESPDLVERLNG